MARMARVMLEQQPVHVTHRGNQRKRLFFSDEDHGSYLRELRRYSTQFEMAIWAYCLMPNHVHLVVVGARRSSIAQAVGNTHRAYSRRCHDRREVTGHLWANRFYSTLLDEPHLWAAVRYVELNPVRAGLVRQATDYPWSSARAHAALQPDPLLAVDRPFPGPIAEWSGWLAIGLEDGTALRLRRNTASGRPSGNETFVDELEARLGRRVRPRQRRPKSATRAVERCPPKAG